MTSKIEHKVDVKLKQKYDLAIKRIENKKDKMDALVLFEGDEGEGKTNQAVNFADYVSQQTGREFVNSNVYFNVQPMIDLAKTTKGKIFLWDEPALQGLKKVWWNKAQIQLVQLLMMARKKRHLFIFCITDFTEFNKYIIRRANFMLRVYRRNERESNRRFLYFPKKRLRNMFDEWNSKRKRKYNKYKTLHGTFNDGYLLPMIIDEDKYEQDKDDAIRSIGEEIKTENNRYKVMYEKILQDAIMEFKYPLTINSANDFCNKVLKKPENVMTYARQRLKKVGILKEKQVKTYDLAPLIIVNGIDEKPINQSVAEMPINK